MVPDQAVLEAHARRIWEQREAKKRCQKILAQIKAEAAQVPLPAALETKVRKLLKKEPALPWDVAVAKVMGVRF